MSIISYTGLDYKDTIKRKFKVKEKRYITIRTIYSYTNNEIINYKKKLVLEILNKKALTINNYYRKYYIIKENKLNKSIKKLLLVKLSYEINLPIDLIGIIFNSLKILIY